MYRWWDDNETSVSLDFVLKNKLAVIVSNRIWKKKIQYCNQGNTCPKITFAHLHCCYWKNLKQ